MDLSRSTAVLGEATMHRLANLRVAIVGVGGVGSWCAEALVRTGLMHLLMIDDDVIAASNLNRQCPALADTIGRQKVEVMRERLLAINPEADVVADARRYESGVLPVDFVVDCIDSVSSKARLILDTTAAGIPLVSSLGAARRKDPTKVCLRRFDKIEGDALARALRRQFKLHDEYPASKFICAVSSEVPAQIAELGSIMPVTAAFGMALASAVIG